VPDHNQTGIRPGGTVAGDGRGYDAQGNLVRDAQGGRVSGGPNAAPLSVVTRIAPATGPIDTAVVISGTGLSGATAVKFGNTAAKSFSVTSDTAIAAVAPAGTGSVDVTVTTPGGTSAISAAGKFILVAPPIVVSIAPAEGPTAGGTVVAVTGTGFTGASSVKFGASAADLFTVNGDTSLVATSPPGADAVDVVVTTPAGASAPGVKFGYVGLPVVVAKCTPNAPVGNDGTVIQKAGTALVVAPAGYGTKLFGNLAVVLPSDTPIDGVVEVHAVAREHNRGFLASVFPPIGESIGSRPVSTGINADAASAVTSDSGRVFRKVSATNWQSLGGRGN
jgi:hypothetical protein